MDLIKIIKETGTLPASFKLESGERIVLSECSIPTGGFLLYYHEVFSGNIIIHEVGKTQEQAQENLKNALIGLSPEK